MADPVTLHTVAHVAKHIAPYCKPFIMQGYSIMEMLISSLVSAAVAGGLAWYIRGRGMTGVAIDISNIKNDIENLKAKVSPAVPATAVVAS